MLPILALAASGAAFIAAVRIVPGLDFSEGRSLVGLIVVTGLVSLVAVAIPSFTARLRPGAGPISVAIVSVVTQAVLLLVVALIGWPLRLGLSVGGWPEQAGAVAIVSALLAAAVQSIVPVARVATGRARDAASWMPAMPDGTFGPSTAVLAMFFLSGAAGLIYEVVWARQLVLVFGNTTQAVSAILTGYFGGLAIGAVVGGRIADRVTSPLRLYGIVEILLVGIVLVTPVLFDSLHELYRGWYSSFENAPTTLALLRYVLALLALAPATILMGATLPTLSRHLTRRRDELSANFGRLYAMNTTGAVVGTVLAGLALIELFGLTATLAVGAIGSGVAGIAALILARRSGPLGTAVTPTAAPEALPPSPTRNLGLIVAFVSGLTSLGYQVLWTRLLSSGSGNTTYVFTLILAIFLVGIALGAAFFVRRLSGGQRLVAWLGIAQLLIATIALVGIPFLARVIEIPFLARVAVVVLPATLVLGLTLPMASSLVGADEHRAGRDAGLLLGANTFGAICATFLIPFALIPAIGSPRSVALLALVNAALGAAILARQSILALPRRATAAVGIAIAIVASVATFVPNRVVADPGLTTILRGGTHVYASTEDEIASVQAGDAAGLKRLMVAGTGMTSLTVDARLMTYIPLMLRPESRDLLVIAFGMGSSWRSGLVAGLSADGVELVPSVPQMLGYYHPDADALRADPRARIVIADGRNYAELSGRSYDIIVVDPPPPIHASGTAILYSQEFYRASAARLRDGGVMMMWISGGPTMDEFRAHVRTFTSVFPNTMLAYGPVKKGIMMLGSDRPLAFDPAAIDEVLARPGVLADLEAAYDEPVTSAAEWAALIPDVALADDAAVRRLGGVGPLITDDQPLPEYFLLRDVWGPPSPPMNLDAVRKIVAAPG
jgi:spermidine synthase